MENIMQKALEYQQALLKSNPDLDVGIMLKPWIGRPNSFVETVEAQILQWDKIQQLSLEPHFVMHHPSVWELNHINLKFEAGEISKYEADRQRTIILTALAVLEPCEPVRR